MANQRCGSSSQALLAALLAWLLLIAAALPSSAQATERPDSWSDASHGNRAPANYDLVLPDDRINEIYIRFTPEAWAAEEADMIALYGERGADRQGELGGAGRERRPNMAELAKKLDRTRAQLMAAFALMPDFDKVAQKLDIDMDALAAALGLPDGIRLPARMGPGGFRARAGGALGSGNLQLVSRNPIWVPVTIGFADRTWLEVGFRYKGNSTLMMGWGSGEIGLPFKLDFDEFEDDHPELRNQRLYGFKQLSFANNEFDPSWQREKVTADIFRAAGAPAAETAYYAVYVDEGSGGGYQYWGVYTAIELPDDTLIETQFADDNGNMYKPDGPGATFAQGAFSESSFDKETNKDSDYADILALFDALHADNRLSDPAGWRAGLEAVFEVDGFLRWLATNSLVQNWDTYGNLPHNYYLYANEETGQLVWIPWDNNMALSSTVGLLPPLSLALDEIESEAWPLIGFVLDDEIYANRYIDFLRHVSADVFRPQRMEAIYEANYRMLAAYVGEREGEDAVKALRAATDDLLTHANERAEAAAALLADYGEEKR